MKWAVAEHLVGALELVTAPSGLAVGLDVAKTHLRVDHNYEDDRITAIIQAATRFCEQEITGAKSILNTTYDLPLRGWWCGKFDLPRPPLSSVTSVKYYDGSDTLQTLATTYYDVRTPHKAPGFIETKPTLSLPALGNLRNWPVVVRFVAGYGATESSVPAVVKQAILLCCGWMYDQREPVKAELDAVERLLRAEEWGAYG